ncbi:MAG: response regulator transcription factor [Bacteroidales bacterium]
MNTYPPIEYFSNKGELFFSSPTGVFPFNELPCSYANTLRSELEHFTNAIAKIENESDPFMQLKMFAQLKTGTHSCIQAPYGTITKREIEIAQLIPGRTDKEIALELGISVNTVISHIAHILQKIGAHTRTAIKPFGLNNNLI